MITIFFFNIETTKDQFISIQNLFSFHLKSKAITEENIPIQQVNISEKETIVSSKQLSSTFIQMKKNQPIIYLTFDDGPNHHTKKIISILKKEDVLATFFILQPNALRFPEIIKQINDEGHALACHGVTHTIKQFYQTEISPLTEMETCKQSIYDIIGQETNFIRTPYGSVPHLNDKQKKKLEKEGFYLWDWNVDSDDWMIKNKNQLIHHTLQQVEKLHVANKTPVVLFHDTEVTANALPQIIKRLKELNYDFRIPTENDVPVQFHVKK